jgi:hypothetical protein
MESPDLRTTSVRAWPICPQCGANRVTRCTFCNTTGTKFCRAEVDFGRLLGLSGNAKSPSCCGPEGCSPLKEVSKAEELHQLGGPASPADSVMLLCPTCDEPFTPQFARRCSNCGHESPDGFDQSEADKGGEGLNLRILFCLGGVILFAVATLVYFWRLF